MKKKIIRKIDGCEFNEGIYYSIYFKTSFKKEILIEYVSKKVEKEIRPLFDTIKYFIKSEKLKKSEKFELNVITKKAAIELNKIIPPPPPPPSKY